MIPARKKYIVWRTFLNSPHIPFYTREGELFCHRRGVPSKKYAPAAELAPTRKAQYNLYKKSIFIRVVNAMKALIAVDGSEGSLEATRQAVRLYPQFDQFVLCYVIRWSGEGISQLSGVDLPLEAEAEAPLQKCRDIFTSAGLPAPTSRVERPIEGVSRQIVQAAEEEKADLIIIGTRGRGDLTSMLLGSVSRGVIAASTRPVLVVPPGVRRE